MFLLHFAGGNRNSYQFLTPHLTDFDLIPLELPGRGRRFGEPLIKDFDSAAHDLFVQARAFLATRTPFLIYGHSMGAALGFRLAGMLENAGFPPAWLFVSGNCGPGVGSDVPLHLLPQEEFIQELVRLGGIPPEVLSNTEIMDFYLPLLRADFELVEKYVHAPADILGTPIYAMMGAEEKHAELIANWGKFTRASFDCLLLDGGHFFIYRHVQKIAERIKAVYGQRLLQ